MVCLLRGSSRLMQHCPPSIILGHPASSRGGVERGYDGGGGAATPGLPQSISTPNAHPLGTIGHCNGA